MLMELFNFAAGTGHIVASSSASGAANLADYLPYIGVFAVIVIPLAAWCGSEVYTPIDEDGWLQ